MQQTIDDRAALAERLVLDLEHLGYRFVLYGGVTGTLLLYSGKAKTITDSETRAIMKELKPVEKELCAYLTERGKSSARKCKRIAEGAG